MRRSPVGSGDFQIQALAQRSEKRLHIGDQTDRLKGPPVGKLRDHGRINIHTHGLHRSRKQIAGGDCMQSCRHHHRETYAANFLAHQFLGLQGIDDDVGKRAIIANRSGENKIHAFLTQL